MSVRACIVGIALCAGLLASSNAVADKKTTVTARQDMIDRCAQHAADCNWLATLGSLERASVKRALNKHGVELDPQPWGKTIDGFVVEVEPVFVEGGSALRILNALHIKSKNSIVSREMLINVGEVWDQARIEESGRRMRDSYFSSIGVVIPIRREQSDKVGVLIVTRDIWSLRANTDYRYQNGRLTNLTFSFAEQNFLGRRKIISAVFRMTQDQIAIGPSYNDRNVLGKRWRFNGLATAIFARNALIDDRRFEGEGTQSDVDLTRPLWSLSSRWGGAVSFAHRFSIERLYKGTDLRTYDAPETAQDDALPWVYRQRRFNIAASLQRQFGSTVKNRISWGHSFESQRPRLADDFSGDDQQAEAFTRDVLPRNEQNSVLFVSYNAFTPVFRTLTNIRTYDLSEDVQFGPNVSGSLGIAPRLLGSTANFARLKLDASYTWGWCHDGMISLTASAFFRLQQSSGFIDNTADARIFVAAPSNRYGRFVMQAQIATRWNDTQNRFYLLGSDTGLRGYRIGEFSGQRLASAQVEARSKPLKLSALRFGGVAFYDIGSAADTIGRFGLHHNIGFGLRTLTPQTSRELFRFDFAFPLDGRFQLRPQFVAGFGSEF